MFYINGKEGIVYIAKDENGKPTIYLPEKINVTNKEVTDLISELLSGAKDSELAVKIYVYGLIKSIKVDFSLLTPNYETLVDKLSVLVPKVFLFNVLYKSMIDIPFYGYRVTCSNAILKKFINSLESDDVCGYGIFSEEEYDFVKRNKHLVKKVEDFIINIM